MLCLYHLSQHYGYLFLLQKKVRKKDEKIKIFEKNVNFKVW